MHTDTWIVLGLRPFAGRVRVLALLFLFGAFGVEAQNADDAALKELRGQVLNSAGGAVTNAIVTVRAVTRPTGTRYSGNEDVQATARADATGSFVIRGRNPFIAATVTIEAPGFAKGVFSEVPTGGAVHRLTLLEGATVTGTLFKDDEPVAGAKIGISDTEGGSKIFTLSLDATTDNDGRFRIANLPPKREYFLFGVMASLAEKGALAARRITAGTNESVLDVGALKLEPGHIVEGRIAIVGEEKIPATQITLSRDGPRDLLKTQTDSQGHFRFSGVPAEIIALEADVPGHRLTLTNASLDPAKPMRLLGRLAGSKINLVLQFEGGAAFERLNFPSAASREEPLRGAEAPQPGPNTFEVAGSVIDAETQQAIPQFTTSEGRLNRSGSYDWFFTRQHAHSGGLFKTFLTKGDLAPLLVVRAENYLPWVSGAITGATNFIVKLEKGAQLKGVVLKPDGAPAAHTTVFLADQFSATVMSGFSVVRNTAQSATSDVHGRFAFPAQSGAVSLMVFNTNGFAETTVEDLLRSGEIRLRPLSRVEGKLLVGDNPAANELIHLTTAPRPYSWYPRELPAYNITFTTRTDAQGNFTFDGVPSTMLEISHAPRLADETSSATPPAGGFPLTQTQRLLPASGETLRVTLGGQGRPVIGRFEVSGYEAPINWAGSIQSMENVVTHDGPSDKAMKSLMEKLLETGKTRSQQKAAEDAYQAERKSFAGASQSFFATEKGLAALRASRRYFLKFSDDGSFRIEDVPPGKYLIAIRPMNPDPAAINTRRWFIADFQTEITVAEGKTPLDLGVIKIPLPRQK